MNIFIVYAHPEPKSFNGVLFHTAVDVLTKAGHQVQQSDLYTLQFNPVSDRSNFKNATDADFFKQQQEELYATETNGFAEVIDAEQQKLLSCDLMIWQFPLWWFSVPAILKGWVDRVFAMGRVYGQGKLYENGVFKGKKALLSLTTGGGAEHYLPDGFNGDLHGILKPIHRGIFEFTGFSVLEPHVVYGPARLTPEELEREIERWTQRLQNIANEPAITVGRYS
jgi:NAD(P)H dehydrogenase (quinone)